MKVNGAEADDIIAVLAQHLSKFRKRVIIASNDKDFRQLVTGNVSLWSMRDEKWVEVSDPKEFLVCHLLKGDSSDGIPNVRSDDDTFIVDGKRQKPCGDKLVGKILEQGVENFLKQEGLERNWARNKKLIALDKGSIPEKLWDFVVEKFTNIETQRPNYTKILHYFSRRRMRNLMAEVNSFM
jgi:5'-3' exonuclease